MAAPFTYQIRLRGDVVVVTEQGMPLFEDVEQALAAAVSAARDSGKKILFDHRLADVANYYGYIVRHAETAMRIGLDGTFRVALLGTREQDDVLSFMVTVGRNRGWNSRRFLDFNEALQWLNQSS